MEDRALHRPPQWLWRGLDLVPGEDIRDARMTLARLLLMVSRAGVLGIAARGVVRVSLMMTA